MTGPSPDRTQRFFGLALAGVALLCIASCGRCAYEFAPDAFSSRQHQFVLGGLALMLSLMGLVCGLAVLALAVNIIRGKR